MAYIEEEIKRRQLPQLMTDAEGCPIDTLQKWEKRRPEILEMITRLAYGFVPDLKPVVKPEVLTVDHSAVCGKATYMRVDLNIDCTVADPTLSYRDTPMYASAMSDASGCPRKARYTLPVNITIPNRSGAVPAFLFIAFSPLYADEAQPIEEIVDHGYAFVSFCYEDMAYDRPFSPKTGVAEAGRNASDQWGAIAKWAWAASRVMDYVQTLPAIDAGRVAVCGGSRLGKTALWCGINDARFSLVMPMIDGTGGSSLYRGNAKEDLKHLAESFPHWFCGNYQHFKSCQDELPFDSHFLVALCAPRPMYITMGDQDPYVDYESEYVALAAATPVWQLYGKRGFVYSNEPVRPPYQSHEGDIGMHIRPGTHYFSREDWNRAIAFRDKHRV